GTDAVKGHDGLVKLSGYEIAARLSFQFWQTTPDDDLLGAAEQGSLSEDDGFGDAVDHLLSSPRAASALQQFAREWLRLETMRDLDSLNGDPVFDAFAGDNVPSPNLKEDMISELTESLSYHGLVKNETLADWFESPYSFARSTELANIYGLSAWDGTGE